MTDPVRATLEAVYRGESRRIFATLVRLLGQDDGAKFMLEGESS